MLRENYEDKITSYNNFNDETISEINNFQDKLNEIWCRSLIINGNNLEFSKGIAKSFEKGSIFKANILLKLYRF